jgi:hypothetical protein
MCRRRTLPNSVEEGVEYILSGLGFSFDLQQPAIRDRFHHWSV